MLAQAGKTASDNKKSQGQARRNAPLRDTRLAAVRLCQRRYLRGVLQHKSGLHQGGLPEGLKQFVQYVPGAGRAADLGKRLVARVLVCGAAVAKLNSAMPNPPQRLAMPCKLSIGGTCTQKCSPVRRTAPVGSLHANNQQLHCRTCKACLHAAPAPRLLRCAPPRRRCRRTGSQRRSTL